MRSIAEWKLLPEGYTFGWNNGGSNLHFGGDEG